MRNSVGLLRQKITYLTKVISKQHREKAASYVWYFEGNLSDEVRTSCACKLEGNNSKRNIRNFGIHFDQGVKS